MKNIILYGEHHNLLNNLYNNILDTVNTVNNHVHDIIRYIVFKSGVSK